MNSFLYPFIGIVIGIISGVIGSNMTSGIILIIISVISYFFLLIISRDPIKAWQLKSWHFLWLFLIFCGIGIVSYNFNKNGELKQNEQDNINLLTGTVNSVKSLASGDLVKFTSDNQFLNNGENLKIKNLDISFFTNDLALQPGDIIILKIKHKSLQLRKNIKSNFINNNKNYFIDSKAIVSLMIKDKSFNLSYFATSLRDRLEIKIEKSNLNRATAEFIIALLLGDKEYIDSNVKRNFDAAGISHILALSGLHIAIIASFFLFLFYPLKYFGKRNLCYVLTIISILGYTILTGCSPSTLRACIMSSFILLSFILQRKKSTLNSLLFAMTLILAFDPLSIFNIGLQLSFLSVAAIILFVNNLNFFSLRNNPKLHKTLSVILVSVVTTFTTWIVIAYYFNRVSLLFLPANLILVPFLPCFMGLSFIYFIFLLFDIDFTFLVHLLDYTYNLYEAFCDYISSFKFALLEVTPDIISVILWMCGIGFCCLVVYAKRKAFSGLLAVGCFLFALFEINPSSNSQQELMFRKNYYSLSVNFNEGLKQHDKKFPRNCLSRIAIGNHEIISLDCETSKMPANKLASVYKNSQRWLLLGSGIKKMKLADIEDIKNFERIIIHPSINRKKERELFQEADLLQIPIYSLREEGSLCVNEFDLEEI